jgi:hypothetical protein
LFDTSDLGGTVDSVVWWNFVGRSHEEIAEARATWEAERARGAQQVPEVARFGPVTGYDGPALPAPALPNTPLKPPGWTR